MHPLDDQERNRYALIVASNDPNELETIMQRMDEHEAKRIALTWLQAMRADVLALRAEVTA